MSNNDFCAFTIARDESEFLPVWAKYYSQVADCVIIDNDTKDGSVEVVAAKYGLRVHHAPSRYRWDRDWILRTVTEMQGKLLKEYRWVLFSTPDEFVVPNTNHYPSLREYVDAMVCPYVYCGMGYHVTDFSMAHGDHHCADDKPIDWNAPLIRQRHFWVNDISYGKPLLSSIPLIWVHGFHSLLLPHQRVRDEDLYLVHLHRIDFDSCHLRHRRMSGRWGEEELCPGMEPHNHLFLEGEPYRKWFYDLTEYYGIHRQEIPSWVKGVL